MVLASSGGGSAAFLLLFALGLYFMPTIVAVARKLDHQGSIAVINFFLGLSHPGV
jgi:hypothetical protein